MMGENNWFATEMGQTLVRETIEYVTPWLWPICGHNALVLLPTLGLSVPQLQCVPQWYVQRSGSQLVGDFHAEDANLPLASDCLAMVYAAFIMETSIHSEVLIAEFERLLVAEGHLALLTLNPYSLPRLTGRWKHLALQSHTQWVDLLQKAGLEVCRHEVIGAYWPCAKKSQTGKNSYRPNSLRSVNFMLAKKRKAALTPIRKNASAVALAKESICP